MNLDYFLVDVFARTPLEGNPLAVVMSTTELSAERMQAIAREFHLSETTFVERRAAAVEQAEGVRTRIFTIQEELPFAGHPTLGTAAVLRTVAPEMVREDTLVLALNVGRVPVCFTADGVYGEMTQRDPEFGPELDQAEVARLTGLRIDDLDPRVPPRTVSTGTPFAIVPLRSDAPLARLKVNHGKADAWLRAHGARFFYVLGPTGREKPSWRARMQFYGGEDPATGSAAGCAISHLVAGGAVAPGRRIHLQQGVEIARVSDLFLSARLDAARVTDVRVGGSTVLVAKGQLFLPQCTHFQQEFIGVTTVEY